MSAPSEVVNQIITPLSGRIGSATSSAATNGTPLDCAIGGVMFRYATAESRPYQRGTVPFNREQTDTEAEPGEQSLSGWWLRSQASFHEGAGALYQEDFGYASYTRFLVNNRFRESMGIDVWTAGKTSLLADTVALQAGAGTSLLAQGNDGSTPVVYQASGSTLYRITAAGAAAVTWGGATTILALEVYSGSYYAVCSTGIYKGTIAGGAGTKVWTLGAAPGSCFFRRRGGSSLFVSDQSCYDLTDETGALPKALPAAFFTVVETDWTWTAAVEALADVRVAGISNGVSTIWTFTPVIAGGWTSAYAGGLPRGEEIRSLANYYNTALAVGTDRGVRLASYDANGQYSFGPLTWKPPAGGGPVRGLAVIDRFVYAAAENALADGTSGLVRIDPETPLLKPGYFAWANDLSSGTTGTTGSVVDLGGRPAFCLSAGGSYVAHATQKVATGYLTTGRIRFRTLEPKLFKAIRLRADALVGTISVDALNDADTLASVATYSSAGITDLEEASLPLGRQETLALRFTLVRSVSDATSGPTLRSYQVKALPAPQRQRAFDFWVECFDVETARNGQRLATERGGLTRLEALEAVEGTSDLVMYQDFGSGSSWLVEIDSIQFVQTSPPGVKSAWGGRINIKMRVAE